MAGSARSGLAGDLPLPLIPVYLGRWPALILACIRLLAGLGAWFNGFGEVLRTDCGGRRRMRWRTVGRIARLGGR